MFQSRQLRASIVLGVFTIWFELSKETVIILKILADFEKLHVQLTRFDETRRPSFLRSNTDFIHTTSYKTVFPESLFLGPESWSGTFGSQVGTILMPQYSRKFVHWMLVCMHTDVS